MKRILLVSCFVLFPIEAFSEYNTLSTQVAEHQRKVEIYDEQSKKTIELQRETERQLKESTVQQEALAIQLKRAENQADRKDHLLERWEQQADRYDALLDRWETKKGLGNL